MKYYKQFEDAIEKLGIENLHTNDLADKPYVFLGFTTGENITLWRALQLVMSDIHICYQHILNNGLCELKWDQLVNISGPRNPPEFSMIQGNKSLSHGNAEWFKKYSENKYLSHFILDKNNIAQPKQIMFRETSKMIYCKKRVKRRFQELKAFLNTLPKDTEIVIKPIDWKCGNNIFFSSTKDILELENFIYLNPELEATDDLSPKDDNVKNEFIRCGVIFGNTLFQERIKSYPIEIDWIKKDWNLRILTTYDAETNTYVVSWMPWRIDNDWGAVNRSISAENISLEDIWKLAWWDNATLKEVKKRVEDLAIHTTTIMARIWNRKDKKPQVSYEVDFQNLAWIDIIVDENLEPHILEVNDSASGCIYESMLLDGIESVLPIAKSIKAKIEGALNADKEILKIIYKMSPKQQKEALEKLGYQLQWEVEVEIEVKV